MASRLLLAGLTVLVAAGCGGGGEPAQERSKQEYSPEAQEALDELDEKASRQPDEAERIAATLQDRARALEGGDALALRSTSDGRQQARDRVSARRAKRLAIERVRIFAEDVQISGSRAKVHALLTYRVRGMRRSFATVRRITARKRSVGWRVTRDSGRGERLPWEVAAFEVTRAPHVVLLTAPGVDPGPLRAGLVEAYREIRRDLPARDLPRRVLVIGARDERQTEQLAGPIAKGVVALANVRVTFGSAPAFRVERVFGQRMIVVGSMWNQLDAEQRAATLAHEMTHTALNPDTSGRTPPWLTEGAAMHVAGENRTDEALARAAGLGPAKRLSELCGQASIRKLSGRQQGAAYAAASAAAEAIVERHGTEGLFELYDAFNDPRYRARSCNKVTDLVMRKTLGMRLAELEAAITG